MPQKYFSFGTRLYFGFSRFSLLHWPILGVESEHHQGRNEMSIFENNDAINDILNQLADEGMIEPTVEPIDDPSNLTDFWDWAEVVGVVDEFAPLDERF